MKIKVLQVVGNLRIGGAETVAMNIYRYIDRDKYEFHYLVYGNEIGDYEKEVEQLGGKVIHISYSPHVINKTYYSDLKNIVKQYGPYEIIHAHMMLHNALILKFAEKLKIPIRISHAHSTTDGAEKKNLIQAIVREVYSLIAKYRIRKYATTFISCGDRAGIYLYGKKFYMRNGILIKNGIEIEKYLYNPNIRDNLRRQNNLNNKLVLACIGHFERVKNHEFLIRIFKKIHDVNPKAILYLLGDGPLKPEIEKQVREAELQDCVLMTGNVTNVSDWMQAIDYLLMPSLYEGVPLTLIEAQVAGLKCFVSDKVSKEVNITGNIKFLPLDKLSGWLDIAFLDNEYNRKIDLKMIQENGYDVKTNIHLIEKLYNRQEEKIIGKNKKNE